MEINITFDYIITYYNHGELIVENKSMSKKDLSSYIRDLNQKYSDINWSFNYNKK